MTTFAVVTPSRGLVHSRTIEAVLRNIDQATQLGHRYLGWCFTHCLPIPECDERAAELGMERGARALWFVEEDVIPPLGALVESIDLVPHFPVVAVDYPVGAVADGWGCIVRDSTGEIEWCGLGATLIRREVFEALPRPWFSTDWRFVRHGNTAWDRVPSVESNERRYGQQDIYFCMNLRAAGFRIGQVPGMVAGHAKVDAYGAQGTNVGWHQISIRDRIERQYPGLTR